MFGGWPHELLTLPVSEFKVLTNYYFAVKSAESAAHSEGDSEGV